MAEQLKHQAVLHIIKERALDVLFLTETHATQYHQYKSQHHLFIVNGNNKDKYGGVTAIIPPRTLPFLKEVVQHGSRILQVTLSSSSGDMHFLGVYAPHNKHDLEIVKTPFWEHLKNIIARLPRPEPVFIIGDFNVRLQGRRQDEVDYLGPHILGRGRNYISDEPGSNRRLLLDLLKGADLKDALSFKQPNLVKQVTYRDKYPPPSDWLQFASDPLGLVQFWDKIQNLTQNETTNLHTASIIRSFLITTWPVPPQQLPPMIDPLRFQTLDRLLTRSQWLPAIHTVKAVHCAGFPSDHYLLETAVKVKLKACREKTPLPPKIDYSAITPEQKRDFNLHIRSSLNCKVTTPPILNTSEWKVYTDGSGSSGRCTSDTPAGWGFCIYHSASYVEEACGPVTTDPRSSMYVGATVGSNNTAELTALIEAALYALSQKNPPSSVTFYYDSKWAADTIRGRSKPKRHKLLVRQASNTLNALQSATTVNWSWVKGHSGDQGNRTADRLAEKGKTEAQYHGGRHTLPSMLTPSTLPQPDDNIPGDDVDGQFDALYHATKRAQQTHFPTLRYTPSKPWITADLAQEIGRARHKRIANHHDHAAFYKEVKKKARKAKTAWLRDNLLKDTNTAHKTIWKQVQNFRRGFRAKHTRLKRLGRPVPWTSTHKVFKEHLETQQWGPSTVSSEELELLDSSPLIANPPAQAPEPFTLEEMLTALAKLRAGRAPGLDGIPADSLHQLDHTN